MSKRIVLKFGTGILTKPGTVELDGAQFVQLVSAVAELRAAGYQCIVVSSGAVAAGLPAFAYDKRPSDDVPALQACAAVGQSRLMHHYATLFRYHDLDVAQLLLTHDDLAVATRSSRIKATLDRLLEQKTVIPIINENDSVAVEELRFGDNDALSASLAILAEADLLILLTSVRGLHPSEDNGSGAEPGEIIPLVHDIAEVRGHARADKGELSTGGMTSKLASVEKAVNAGIETVIASGRHPQQLLEVARGGGVGTRFLCPVMS